VDAVVERALATGRSARTPMDGLEVRDGLDPGSGPAAAVPLRCGGETVGTLSCAWDAEPVVDRRHAELLLIAAATAVAPHALRLAETRAADATPAGGGDTLGLLGDSDAMRALRARVLRVAAAPFHVLVDGESGSGKELVARALHAAGPRRQRRLSTVNCAALSDELLEAELFGHARGAFTGAVRDRAGLFEEADGGTLFLDEVGELSLRAQAKLLRVIQDGEVRRVGECHARRVDVRLVAATNRVLAEEVEAGRFRADLRYRLEVVRIAVVPLRERPDDVAVLARAFWTDAAARTGTRAALHPGTLAALARYPWPGNVRELQNVIERIAVNSGSDAIQPEDLPSEIKARRAGTMRPKQERRRTIADDLYQRLVEERQSFWSVVYPLYMQREITRSNVRDVVRKGLQEARGNYKIVARLFNMEQGDYKRFLNFLRKHDCQVPFKEYR